MNEQGRRPRRELVSEAQSEINGQRLLGLRTERRRGLYESRM